DRDVYLTARRILTREHRIEESREENK
ncbi:DUF910 domain-containing protein, partial [Listeria monocytogenes]|nr:DUF910 domain-containing protein [Listeria monocytogenes]